MCKYAMIRRRPVTVKRTCEEEAWRRRTKKDVSVVRQQTRLCLGSMETQESPCALTVSKAVLSESGSMKMD